MFSVIFSSNDLGHLIELISLFFWNSGAQNNFFCSFFYHKEIQEIMHLNSNDYCICNKREANSISRQTRDTDLLKFE